MIDSLRNYLLSLCGCSILISLFRTLMPGGKFKRVMELAGGLLLLIVVLSPVVHLDEFHFQEKISQFLSVSDAMELEYASDNREAMDRIISENCTEYILDKAESLGMAVDVKIQMDEDAAVSYPIGVTIYGAYNSDQKSQMSVILEQDLGIPPSEQEWIKN